MPFGRKDQVVCKLGVAEQSTSAFQNVAMIDFKRFSADNNFFSFEAGLSRRELEINDIVQFLRSFV